MQPRPGFNARLPSGPRVFNTPILRAPIVYRLGLKIFNLARGVRLPLGAPPFALRVAGHLRSHQGGKAISTQSNRRLGLVSSVAVGDEKTAWQFERYFKFGSGKASDNKVTRTPVTALKFAVHPVGARDRRN
jgi:hypothetical protein